MALLPDGFELLNNENWDRWKTDIKVLLLDKGCWSFIEGKEEELDGTATRKERQEFNLRKDRTFTTLYYGIKPEYRPLIQDCSDGKLAWEKLVQQFEPKTRARLIQLLDEFFSIKYQPTESIGIFIARLKAAVKKLAEAGHELDKLFQGFQAIRHLPPEFSGIVQLIYRWSDTEFTIDKIAEELIKEESRLTQVKADSCTSEVSAFNISSTSKETVEKFCDRRKTQNKAVREQSRKVGPCHYCHKYGHLIANCKDRDARNFKPRCNKQKKQFSDHSSSLAETYTSHAVEVNEISNRNDAGVWVLDSAATTHFCKDRSLMLNYQEATDVNMSLAVENTGSTIVGKGIVNFSVKLGKEISEITLNNVLYNPEIRRNLLSISRLEAAGAHFVGSKGKIKVFSNDWEELFYATRRNGLYYLKPYRYKTPKAEDSSYNVGTSKKSKVDDATLWHRRYCHINFDYLKETSTNQSVRGLPNIEKPVDKCDVCMIAKSNRVSFKPIPSRTSGPLELVYMDVCGPMPTTSRQGNRYYLAIIDDYSRAVVLYLMKYKNEAFRKFKNYHAKMERLTGRKLKCIRTDNGGEFCNTEFQRYLDEQGIRTERTNYYTPEENGVCERFNRTALDAVKSMLKDSSMDDKWWDEAVCCFVHSWNRISRKGRKTPYELLHGKKPPVMYFKVFGCKAYVGVPKQKRNKLQMRAKEGIMVGYAFSTKGYRIYLTQDHKVIETRNVKFNENKYAMEDVLGPSKKVQQRLGWHEDENEDSDAEDNKRPETLETPESEPSTSTSDVTKVSDLNWLRKASKRSDGSRNDIYYYIEGSKSRFRSLNDIEKYCESHGIKFEKEFFDFSGKNEYSGKVTSNCDDTLEENEANLIEHSIPKSYKEAIESINRNEWEKAMQDEIDVMKKRNVWSLVEKPDNAKVIGSRWVYNVKKNESDQIVRYKARLVAQGFKQQQGIDYDDVYSPVVNFSLIRLFFAIFVGLLKWANYQVDIKSAYLYAELSEETYMSQPEGFEEDPSKVCKLKKAIYGLHQSGREWYTEIANALQDLKLEKLDWCNGVFAGKDVLLLLYVDDIVVFGKSQENIDIVVQDLSQIFELKILGETRKLLGVEFENADGNLFIHQKEYIENTVKHFSKQYKIPIVSLPIAKGIVLTKQDCPQTEEEKAEMEKIPYRRLLGCVAFIASRTRPEISYAVNILSQYQENPGQKHWQALLKVLGYLQYTKGYMLNLKKISNLSIECFTDADHASNRDDRVSIGGTIIYVGGVPIVWKTFKQKSVSISTMEAEYISLSESAKELVWLKNVLMDSKLELKVPSCYLYCDNSAAIDFSKSSIENSRSKHIDVRYHFVRQYVNEKFFELKFVRTVDNTADLFTKPVVKEHLRKFCNKVYFRYDD